MLDKIQITRTTDEESAIDIVSRETNEKLQAMARSLVSSLWMLVRSVKMYDPDNDVFVKPLTQLQETMNQIVRKEGKLEFMGVKRSFFLNGMLIKVDLSALENVADLLTEMRAKDVGGFTVIRSVSMEELKAFIWVFSNERSDPIEEDVVRGRKLISMKLAKWSKLKDKLENEKDEGEARLDRKKYALTCYGRAVFFIRKYMASLNEKRPINTSKSLRIIQDLVDLSVDQKTHLLGLTTTRTDSEYLSFHQVNTCLISIILGHELGLTKPQLRDLGYIALFHDAGMGTVSDTLLGKRGALTEVERAAVNRAPLIAVRSILRERSINRSTLFRLVTTFEHKVEFGTAVRDGTGNVQMIITKTNLGLYAKIISMCATYDALTSKRPFRDAYSPEVALMLMWSELRNKFDPEILRIFMRVMAIQPIRILTKRQQSLTIGMI